MRATLSTNDTTWVGEKITLIVELLAPGYFASEPSFDLRDPQGVLLLPSSEHPIVSSETLDNVSYMVQRHELSVFATRPGKQTIPAFKVRFAFKHAPLDTNAVAAAVTSVPLPFTVQLPPGAERLGNIISAKALKVEEVWQPEPGKTNEMTGATFIRTVTFRAPDVPGMVFPPFPAGQIDGLGIYVKRQVNDQTEHGVLSGERRDVITYVCQRAGQFTIPAAQLVWFDLDVKRLRTNALPARTFSVIPNPAMAAVTSPNTSGSFGTPTSRRTLLWTVTGAAFIAVLMLVVWRNRRVRCIVADCVALFRPVHLEALNPKQTL